MVEGHATWREEATAHLTPGRLATGAPAAHLGALGEGQPVPPAQPLLCRSPAWGAPGPGGPVLARAEPAVGGGGRGCPWAWGVRPPGSTAADVLIPRSHL